MFTGRSGREPIEARSAIGLRRALATGALDVGILAAVVSETTDIAEFLPREHCPPGALGVPTSLP